MSSFARNRLARHQRTQHQLHALEERSIDWLGGSRVALTARFPALAARSAVVAERLAALLLQRLPHGIAGDLLALLPPASLSPTSRDRLRRNALAEEDRTIGHPDFVSSARFLVPDDAFGNALTPDAIARLVADAFLWSMAHDLPVELKERMAGRLPAELRARMDLRAGYSHQDKVA